MYFFFSHVPSSIFYIFVDFLELPNKKKKSWLEFLFYDLIFFRFSFWIPNTKMAIKKVNFKRDFLCLNFSFFFSENFVWVKSFFLLFVLYCPLRIVVEAWNCGGRKEEVKMRSRIENTNMKQSFPSTLHSLYLVYWVKCLVKKRKELRNWIMVLLFCI